MFDGFELKYGKSAPIIGIDEFEPGKMALEAGHEEFLL